MKTSERKTIKILGERNISLNLENTAHHELMVELKNATKTAEELSEH